jgi:GT2 family glycosyltransferase
MIISPQQQSHSVYIILPVHNRKAVTLNCLAHLKEKGDLNTYHIVVVDDGSTDETAQSVLHQFPTVKLLKGNGALWWTGAIRLGMEYALSKGADYCIWLNDDTLPENGAVKTLIDYCDEHPKTIVAANILDPHTYEPSYGGVIRQKLKIIPTFSKERQQILCDGLNGNLVCFPNTLINDIGYPNNFLYPHYHGDTIYTHSAQRAGYKLVILHEAIAYCKNDHSPITWLRSNKSLIEIIQERLSIKSPHYWKAHLAYYISFFGIFGATIYIYEVWIKMLLLIMVKRFLLREQVSH